MVYMAGLVFAVGGFNGSLRVRTVDSYDPVKDQWTSVANMRDRRSTLGAAVLNGLLYAVGGFDGSTGEPFPRATLEQGVLAAWGGQLEPHRNGSAEECGGCTSVSVTHQVWTQV